MKIQKKKRRGECVVPMTPLIDCVFLLLIFFLVTGQLKRWERQIPVSLADPTASVSAEMRSDAFSMGLSTDNRVFMENGRDKNGVLQFAVISDVDTFITQLIAQRGNHTPIELVVEEETPFQTVIDLLDRLQLAGLDQVRSRMRNGKL